MKKTFVFIISFLLLFAAVSCDLFMGEEKTDSQASSRFSTPGFVGKVSVPKESGVSGSDIWIQAIGADGTQKSVKASADGSFAISGLSADQTYSLFFSSKAPSSSTRGWEQGFEEGNKGGNNGNHYGWDNKGEWPKKEEADIPESDSYGSKIEDVTPEAGSGYNIETVPLKPTGTISGYVILEGAAENECYGIDVYIPGTSFIAKTDDDGSFAISDVPEGTYSLRYEKDGYVSVKSESFTIVSTSSEHPVVAMPTTMLVSDSGIVKGFVHLSGCTDFSTVTAKLEPTTNGNFVDITSKDGSYEIVGVKPGTYSLVLMKDGFVSSRVDNVVVEASKTTEISDVITLISNGSDIKGKVTCADGSSTAGIIINAKCLETESTPEFNYTTSTDSTGSYTLAKCYPGKYTLTITKTGYTTITVEEVTVENGANTTVEDKSLISHYGRITGQLATNDSNSPIATVILAVNSDGTKRYTVSADNEGKYSIDLVEPGIYSLSFSKTGYTPAEVQNVSVVSGNKAIVNLVEMKSTCGTLKVNVAYAGSKNTNGITVSVFDGSQKIATGTTSNVASIEFTDIPVKEGYKVEAEAVGYSVSVKENIAVLSGSQTEITLNALQSNFGSIKGLVTDSNDNPIVGAQVNVGEYSIFTNSKGEYEKTGLAIGSYNFEIVCSGYDSVTLARQVQISSGSETLVPTQKMISIYGLINGVAKIKNASDNSGISVVAECSNPKNTLSTVTNQNGKYSFSNVTPGTYTVKITKDGYTVATKEGLVVTADGVVNVADVELIPATGLVSGRIILEDSTDCSGAAVLLVNVDDSSKTYSTTASADGTYVINLVNPADYTVEISKSSFITDKTNRITVEAGKTALVTDVTLKSTTSKVSGVVTLLGAPTSEGVTVLLSNKDNSFTASTEQNGSYVITKVVPGTYTLTISMPGYVSKIVNNVVIETATTKVIDSYSLEIGTRSINGTVTLENKTDYSGVLVTATKTTDTQKIYSAITNSSGVYNLAGMESGEYAIVLSCTGYNSITLPTVDVISGSQKTLEVQELKIQRGTICGAVTLEGRTDYTGIKVILIGTDYEMTTGITGEYSFYVPQGNYSGVQFSKEDFAILTHSEQLALFAENKITLANEEMKAVSNTVYGKVDVLGTADESNVTIKFVDHDEIQPIITDETGTFSFASVPVGTYDLSFVRENVPELKTKISVVAAAGINVGTVSLTPQTASIQGFVGLQDGTELSGILVSVDIGNGTVLTTTTDVSGRYYLGGVPTTSAYTVTYSKEGWVTDSQVLTSKLKSLEVRTLDPITLIDTTAPVLSSVVINNNANSTGNRKVVIALNATDLGSGVTLMRYSWTGDFSKSEWVNFESSFDSEIPADVEKNINGTRTIIVQVKDAAGNVSTTEGDDISLIGQIKSVSGRLSDAELHWVADNNPYVVAENIIVPEGKTLVIDPGVDVLFDGDYAIIIDGTLSAVGTQEKPINFRSSRDYMSETYGTTVEGYTGYFGSWSGISAGTNTLKVTRTGYNETLKEGSRLAYCNIQDIGSGITGNLFIDNCMIESPMYAIGNNETAFSGVLLNSNIKGDVNIYHSDSANSQLFYIYGNVFEHNFDFGKAFPEAINVSTYSYSPGLYGYNMEGEESYLYYYDQFKYYTGYDTSGVVNHFVNNKVVGYPLVEVTVYYQQILFNTFDSNDYLKVVTEKGFNYNTIGNTKNSIEINNNWHSAKYNNFVNNSANPLFSCKTLRTDGSGVDWTYNYWGETYTKVLQDAEKTNNYNIPFITDGYSGGEASVKYKAVNWTNYVLTPWAFAGYQGDKMFDFEFEIVRQGSEGGEIAVGSDIDLSFTNLSDSEIKEYRIAQSIGEISAASWKPFFGTATYLASEVKPELINKTGEMVLFAQVRAADGTTSPIKAVSFGYSIPKIINTSIEDGDIIQGDSLVDLKFTIDNYKSSSGVYYYLNCYIDDELALSGQNWQYDNQQLVQTVGFINPQILKNGDHTLKIEVVDDEVKETAVKEIHFTVNRLIPVVSSFDVDKSSISQGEVITATISIANAKHLKEIRILSDDFVMKTKNFKDNAQQSINGLEVKIDSRYLKNGSHNLYVELEDYAGNITKTAGIPISASVTDLGPTITGLEITEGQTFTDYSTVTMNLNVADANGVKLVKVNVGDNNIYSLENETYLTNQDSVDVVARMNVSYIKNGNYDLVIEATDFAGNITTITKKIIINKELPTVSWEYFYEDEGIYHGDVYLSSQNWMLDGYVLIDDAISKYYPIRQNANSSPCTYSFSSLNESYYHIGTHKVQAVFQNYAGDVIKSDVKEFTVSGTAETEKYGLNKTWNVDGTLKADQYTKYLWNFDTADKTYESVSGESTNLYTLQSTEGIGEYATQIHGGFDKSLTFANNEWTVEFWYKDEATIYSGHRFFMYDICTIELYQGSTSGNSSVQVQYWYKAGIGDATTEDSLPAFYMSHNDMTQWHHYAFTYDGSDLKVYVDGLICVVKEQITLPNKTSLNFDFDSGSEFVDEVRISSKARTADELNAYVNYVKSNNLLPDNN